MGLPASDKQLGAFVIDGGDRRYFDIATFDEWLAHDDQLVALVDAGKLTVRRLPDDEARAHALSVYMHQLTIARDEQDSRLMPRLPELA